MHHSQLEYLIAVRKLQGESAGVRGITLADYMNVSASYIVKLSVYAETNGYVCRCNSRMMRLTEQGERIVTEYLTAAQYMENFFSLLRGRQRHKPQRCNQRRVCNYRKGEECVAFGAEHKSTNRLNFL